MNPHTRTPKDPDIGMASSSGFERDLEAIVDEAFEEYHARQSRPELEAIARLVSDIDPETVLEIGTAEGGSLYVWCQYFEGVERAVSVDKDHTPEKTELFRAFRADVEMHTVHGVSQSDSVRNTVYDLVEHSGVDFLFIDGGSSSDEVKSDFENFAPLVNDGGMVAFHDILTHRSRPDDCDVDEVWGDIKGRFDRNVEVVEDSSSDEYGYGVLFL